jgi:hypothetical protein
MRGPVSPRRELHEHNPVGVAVKEVHMVLSSHFDAGCKTPGCTKTEHLTVCMLFISTIDQPIERVTSPVGSRLPVAPAQVAP